MADNDTNNSTHSANLTHSNQNSDKPQNPQPQETTVIHAAAPASSQSNANLLLILVLFVILVIGVAVAFTLKNKADADLAERNEVKARIAAAGGDSNMLASGSSLDSRITKIVENANHIRTDYDGMRSGYTKAVQELNTLKNERNANMNTITRLSTSNGKLQDEADRLKAVAATAKSYQQQAQMLNERNRDLEQQVAKLRNGPTTEGMKSLQNSLAVARQESLKLTQEVTRLKRQMTGMVDSSKLNGLGELRAQNEQLNLQITALRAKLDFNKLFVKSHDELPLEAQKLFNELKTLEGKSPTDLAAAYTRIGSELKAVNMQRVKFKEGSSLMNFKEQSILKNKLPITATGDYFLVVGYASTTGDAASNETLSANRATSVASLVNQLKLAGQDVRAVYLGQTSRFSKTNKAENQLCEIWRISE